MQCLLAVENVKGSDDGGKVYGSATVGDQQQMLEYDGTSFRKSMTVLFDSMGDDKMTWFRKTPFWWIRIASLH